MATGKVLECYMPLIGRNIAPTISWLQSGGALDAEGLGGEIQQLTFEIELLQVPAILLQDMKPHQVHRITDAGVVFYFCDLRGRRGSTLGQRDGCMLVPMSNVVCINFFGSKSS